MKTNHEGFGIIGVAVILAVVAVIGGVVFYILNSNRTTNKSSLIRECPDAWINNLMPTVGEDKSIPSEYFIFDGQRKEIKDYDLDWIKANCSVKVQKVY